MILVFALSLNHNRPDDIKVVDGLSTWYGVQNCRMAHMTLAQPQKNCYVSQFGRWYPEDADM